jgi:hypothetical protein
MTNAILSFTNYIDQTGASLTASSEALAVANLASPIIQLPWRTETGTEWCQADLGAVQSVGVVCFQIPRSGVMLGPTDTVRLRLDASTPGGGTAYDSGAVASGIVSGIGTWLKFFSVPVSARYVRLDFSAPALSYMQIGRLWVGSYFQPTRNFDFGWGREWSDMSAITKGPKSGLRFRNIGPKFRTLTVAFNSLSDTDADTMEDGDILTGLSSQMLACTNPDSPLRTSIIGTPARTSPIAQANFVQFQKQITLEEDL